MEQPPLKELEEVKKDFNLAFNKIASVKKEINSLVFGQNQVIDQILNYSDRIEMLIFEFHWIDKKEEIFLESVKKLQKYFDIIHIHGNNHFDKLPTGLPIIIEMTLLNKKNNQENIKQYVTSFPIEGLDYSNNPHKEDLAFSFSDDQ